MEPGRPFLAMEPKKFPYPFDHPEFAFQIKWDGIRIIAHVAGGNIRLFNKKGRERTGQYPEITAALKGLALREDLVLDGEMVCLVGGRPDFHRVLGRDQARREGTIKRLSEKYPATFIVFDLVYWAKPLGNLPFWARDKTLREKVPVEEPVVVSETFLEQGNPLFAAVQEQGLEGIVAKKVDSPYRPGKTSSDWLKIKAWRTFSGVVGGYTMESGGTVAALLLGRQEGRGLSYAGKVSASLPYREREALLGGLQSMTRSSSPFLPPPSLKEKVFWVEPFLLAEVDFLDWSSDGYLRHPTLKGFRSREGPAEEGLTKNSGE